MGILDNVREQYLKGRDEEMSLEAYLDLCRQDPLLTQPPLSVCSPPLVSLS